jgi:hypothetical protein
MYMHVPYCPVRVSYCLLRQNERIRLEVGHSQVRGDGIGKLERVCPPRLGRDVLDDDAREEPPERDHLGAEPFAHAAVQAHRPDGRTGHRECWHARLLGEADTGLARSRGRAEGGGRTIQLAVVAKDRLCLALAA